MCACDVCICARILRIMECVLHVCAVHSICGQEPSLPHANTNTHTHAQVADIKQFLSEYGMIWVGDRQEPLAAAVPPGSTAAAALPPKSGVPSTSAPQAKPGVCVFAFIRVFVCKCVCVRTLTCSNGRVGPDNLHT
jgi:hypothetical protein